MTIQHSGLVARRGERRVALGPNCLAAVTRASEAALFQLGPNVVSVANTKKY